MFIRLKQYPLWGLSSLILTVILAASFTLLLFPKPQPALAAQAITCAQSASAQNCDNHDPLNQGCVADAQISMSQDISYLGTIIGSVQRRFSPACHSWWGRVFDYRAGAVDLLGMTIANITFSAPPTFTNNHYRVLYTAMVFDATATQLPPVIIGRIEIAGVVPPPSATIPEIAIPVQK